MQKHVLRAFTFLAIGCLFTSGNSIAHDQASADMATAAKRLLSSLTPEQLGQATFKLEDAERQNWHFVPDRLVEPNGTSGLPLKSLRADQKILAHALPASALSHRGHLNAMTIMALEKLLFDKEGDVNRDPERYYVSVFGTPDAHGTWAWRFEGHHLAINITIVDGEKFSVTPSFMGTNPGKVTDGILAGPEVLKEENEIALRLAKSLDSEQAKLAMIQDVTPFELKDRERIVWKILTNQDRVAERVKFNHLRIPYAKLTREQQVSLLELANLYSGRFRAEVLAGTRYPKGIVDGSKLSFAWLGGTETGEQHYYRIQSDTFVIEFANSRNDANHAHAVWREFDGDFGTDLLRDHLFEHHTDQSQKPGLWRDLCNGKDLTGWKANAYPDSWTIVDGTIRANATEKSSHLFYVGDSDAPFESVKDFELEAEVRSERKSNGGIFVHTDQKTKTSYLHLANGYEIQLNSSDHEARKTGSLYDVVDLPTSPVNESEWFKVSVVVRGKRIIVKRNGDTVVDYAEPENVQRTDERKGRKLNPQGGAIALQAHDPLSTFYFKSIRIKQLP